ncbi:MAG: hypothetical protein WDZ79_03030 [Candidatus Paceibacterota bacterium]
MTLATLTVAFSFLGFASFPSPADAGDRFSGGGTRFSGGSRPGSNNNTVSTEDRLIIETVEGVRDLLLGEVYRERQHVRDKDMTSHNVGEQIRYEGARTGHQIDLESERSQNRRLESMSEAELQAMLMRLQAQLQDGQTSPSRMVQATDELQAQEAELEILRLQIAQLELRQELERRRLEGAPQSRTEATAAPQTIRPLYEAQLEGQAPSAEADRPVTTETSAWRD